MKCNYHPPKLTKEEQQEMASMKSTLPYIDRIQIEKRHWCEVRAEDLEEDDYDEQDMMWNRRDD